MKPNKKPITRQRWIDEDVCELRRYFNEFLDTKTTPRGPFIEQMKKKSRINGGLIHLRVNHLIIKKISNMNHAKQKLYCLDLVCITEWSWYCLQDDYCCKQPLRSFFHWKHFVKKLFNFWLNCLNFCQSEFFICLLIVRSL